MAHVLRDLTKMGIHNDVKLVLKSDQEHAIVDLVKEVARTRGGIGRTLIEQAPRGDSAGNGLVERAVQTIEGQVRVLKVALEEALGVPGSTTHAIFPWMVEHAGDLLTKCSVGSDGLTAYQPIREKRASGDVYEFGCFVMHRVSEKVQGGVMEPRFHEGARPYLGVRRALGGDGRW